MKKYSLNIDVMVPMSDGTKLATDLWLPESETPLPTLLVRTPYVKHELVPGFLGANPNFFAVIEAGYNLVFSENRATSRSEGDVFQPHLHDPSDGADTVRWIAGQPWSDGNVGTFGMSYLGLDQWHTASTGVEPLKAIVPAYAPSCMYKGLWYSDGGLMTLSLTLGWYASTAVIQANRRLKLGIKPADAADLPQLMRLAQGFNRNDVELFRSASIAEHVELIGKYVPLIYDIVAHPDRDEFWTAIAPVEEMEKITTPALTITGWYDQFIRDNINTHVIARERAGTKEAREGQRMIIGPWPHSVPGFEGVHHDRDFGPAGLVHAALPTKAHIDFYDYWLKGKKDALEGTAPVRIFTTGTNEWRGEQAWPLPDTRFTDYYLGGDGRANTSAGDGTLGLAPATKAVQNAYLYDPRRPVPFWIGFLPWLDQAEVERREDVLCFSTPVLDQAVDVTGPVKVKLFVSSSAVDTDFTAKLVDVTPEGQAFLLCDGALRMRYRNSLSKPQMMTPGQIYQVEIDLGGMSNVFQQGHRIRLEVSSSAYPRYDRNSNTGGFINREREEDMIVAINRIHQGPAHPTRLILPIIKR